MNDKIRYKEVRKISVINIISNFSLAAIKAVVGVISGSTALIADAFHSTSDLIGTAIMLQGMKIAHLPPDESHPYGHYRAESITSKILAMIIAATAFGIGYESIQVLRETIITPPKSIAVYIAISSIIVKELMYRYTIAVGKKINSPAVKADALHHRSDAFSSVAALIGIAGAIKGYPVMDPIAGIFVSILILKTAISIYIDAIRDLMDTAPAKEFFNQIQELASRAAGVKSVQGIRARQHGSKFFVDMKICVDPNITVKEGHDVATRAKENILKNNHDVQDVLIHVNPCDEKANITCRDCKTEPK